MDNQQLYGLTKNEIQLLISLYLGDGCFIKQTLNGEYAIQTSSISKDLINFKKDLLSLKNSDITLKDNSLGFNKKGCIYTWRIDSNSYITQILQMSLKEKLNNLDELGLALWFYDDGSLHKSKFFYNLCTHSFTCEENLVIIDYLKKFNINGTLAKEIKKDGRVFWYIRVNKLAGAYEISKILSKYPIDSLSYKLWSSETILNWSTLK